MLRCLAALLMLLTITFSNVETVLGLLRDGAVHHESMAAAALHSSQAPGEHGHEDCSSHGPGHQHGTPADHCTHQHGNLFVPRSLGLVVLAYTIPELFPEPSSWHDRPSKPSDPPPQA